MADPGAVAVFGAGPDVADGGAVPPAGKVGAATGGAATGAEELGVADGAAGWTAAAPEGDAAGVTWEGAEGWVAVGVGAPCARAEPENPSDSDIKTVATIVRAHAGQHH